MERGAGALEQAAVRGVADDLVAEAVDRLVLGRRRTSCFVTRMFEVVAEARPDRSSTSSETASIGNDSPITDAGSTTARSSRLRASRREATRAWTVGGIWSCADPSRATQPSMPRWIAPVSTSIETICSTYSGLPSAACAIRSRTLVVEDAEQLLHDLAGIGLAERLRA